MDSHRRCARSRGLNGVDSDIYASVPIPNKSRRTSFTPSLFGNRGTRGECRRGLGDRNRLRFFFLFSFPAIPASVFQPPVFATATAMAILALSLPPPVLFTKFRKPACISNSPYLRFATATAMAILALSFPPAVSQMYLPFACVCQNCQT